MYRKNKYRRCQEVCQIISRAICGILPYYGHHTAADVPADRQIVLSAGRDYSGYLLANFADCGGTAFVLVVQLY